MSGPRIVVTGTGCLLPGCASIDALWQRLAAGETAVSAHRNPHVASTLCFGHVDAAAAQAAREAVPARLRRYASPCAQWGLQAARDAIADARLDLASVADDRRGVFAAQGDYLHPSLPSFEDAFDALRERGEAADARALARECLESRGADPFFAIKSLANNLLAVTGLALGLRGDCGAFVQDEGAPWAALRSAALSLRTGACEVALVVCAGSHDEALTLAGLQAQGRLSACADGPRSLRPFDLRRDGTIAAEGAVALVLETAAHAARRGARVLAGLAGQGGLVADDDQAYARCVDQALARAGLPATAIDAVLAAGRGEREADARESRLLRALPPACRDLPITTAAPITGTVPGCPVGVLAGIAMLQRRQVPGIAHLSQPLDASLRWASGPPIARPLRHLLVLDAGELGSHSALVLSHPQTCHD